MNINAIEQILSDMDSVIRNVAYSVIPMVNVSLSNIQSQLSPLEIATFQNTLSTVSTTLGSSK